MLFIFVVALSAFGVLTEDSQTAKDTCVRSEVFNRTREYQDGEDLVSDHEAAKEELANVLENLNFTTYRKIKLEAIDVREANKTSKLKRLTLYNKAGVTKLKVEYTITKIRNSTKVNVVPSGTFQEKLSECKNNIAFVYGSSNFSNLEISNTAAHNDNEGSDSSEDYPTMLEKEEKTEARKEHGNSSQPYVQNLTLQLPASFQYTIQKQNLEGGNPNASWSILKRIQQPRGFNVNNQTLLVNSTSSGRRSMAEFSGIYRNGYGQQQLTDSLQSTIAVKLPVNSIGGDHTNNQAVLLNRANAIGRNISPMDRRGYVWQVSGTESNPIGAVVASTVAGNKFGSSLSLTSPPFGSWRYMFPTNSTSQKVIPRMIYNGYGYDHSNHPNLSQIKKPANFVTATLGHMSTFNSAVSSAELRNVSLASGNSSNRTKLGISEHIDGKLPTLKPDILVLTDNNLRQPFKPSSQIRKKKFKSVEITLSRPVIIRLGGDILNVAASRATEYGVTEPSIPSLSSEKSKSIIRTAQIYIPETIAEGATLSIATKLSGGNGAGHALPSSLNSLNTPNAIQNGSTYMVISEPVITRPSGINFSITTSRMGGSDASQTLSSLLRLHNTTKTIHNEQIVLPQQSMTGGYGLRQILLPIAITGADAHKPSSLNSMNATYVVQSGYGSDHIGQMLIQKPIVANPTGGTFNMIAPSVTGYGNTQPSLSSVILLNTTNTAQNGQGLISKPLTVDSNGIGRILPLDAVTVNRYGAGQMLTPSAGNAGQESAALNVITTGVIGNASDKARMLSSLNTTGIVQGGYGINQILIPKPHSADSTNGTLTITTTRIGSSAPQPSLASMSTGSATNTLQSGQISILRPIGASEAGGTHSIVSANKSSESNSLYTTKIVQGAYGSEKPSTITLTTETPKTTAPKITGCGITQSATPNPSNDIGIVGRSACGNNVIIIPMVQPVIPVATGPIGNTQITANAGIYHGSQSCLPYLLSKLGITTSGCENGQKTSSKAEATESVNSIPGATVLKEDGSASRPRLPLPVDTLRTYMDGYINKKLTNSGTASDSYMRAIPLTVSRVGVYDSRQPWQPNSSDLTEVIPQGYDNARSTNSLPAPTTINGQGYIRQPESLTYARYGLGNPLSLSSLLSSSTSRNFLKGHRTEQLPNSKLSTTSQTNSIPAKFSSRVGKNDFEKLLRYASPLTMKIRPSVSETSQQVASGIVNGGSPVRSPVVIFSRSGRYGIGLSPPTLSLRTSNIIPTKYEGIKITNRNLIDNGMDQSYGATQGYLDQKGSFAKDIEMARAENA